MRLIVLLLLIHANGYTQIVKKSIPDKTIVLTFDDGVASHANYVAPLLKKYGFNATFFVCEFPPDFDDKTKYMSWQQIKGLDSMGFEVGNHTQHHTHLSRLNAESLASELAYIEDTCARLGIEGKITSFAYPAYGTANYAIDVLRQRGYLFARGGYNRPYDPEKDHPYLVPGYTVLDTNRAAIMAALPQARNGRVVVLTIHGVPDNAHPWVNTSPGLFESYLRYLEKHKYYVIALRELAKYIDVAKALDTLEPAF